MSINWENIEKEMGGNKNYKDYAPEGKYKVKCDSIEIKEVGSNGSIIMNFGFEADEYQYPKAGHWLTFKNDNFRQYHNRNLMMVLGATKENAQKAVEVCENKSGKDAIVKAYEQTFKKLLAKKPEVSIEVWTDGKYSKADFDDRSVSFPRDNAKPEETAEPEAVDPRDDEEIDIDSLPF